MKGDEDVGWHFEAQCERTQERIAEKYIECQVICWLSFERSGKVLKRQGFESGNHLCTRPDRVGVNALDPCGTTSPLPCTGPASRPN
jgi:hypothetical protein